MSESFVWRKRRVACSSVLPNSLNKTALSSAELFSSLLGNSVVEAAD